MPVTTIRRSIRGERDPASQADPYRSVAVAAPDATGAVTVSYTHLDVYKRQRFGIVLLTPDDIGYAKADGDKEAQPRARQNVVLEMGMLISALGRKNVAILKKQHLEVPSDAQGILYIPFNDHVKEAVPKLVDRLRSSGFVLNPEAITRASS